MLKKNELGKTALGLNQPEWLTKLHNTLTMGNYGNRHWPNGVKMETQSTLKPKKTGRNPPIE